MTAALPGTWRQERYFDAGLTANPGVQNLHSLPPYLHQPLVSIDSNPLSFLTTPSCLD